MINPASKKILAILKKEYAGAKSALNHDNPLQLLVAVILSAQCTDERVNKVTPALFKRYKTAKDFATAEPSELEAFIRSTGFYHAKAKSVMGMGKGLVERFNGKIPETLDELTSLPGVGRKTANVILAEVFEKAEGIVVDTHIKRVSHRLGFTTHTEPEKVEADLMKFFPKKEWINIGRTLIWHGRKVCHARKPNCPSCPVNKLCPSRNEFLAPKAKSKKQPRHHPTQG